MPEVGDVWALWDMVSQGQLLNVSKITSFAQENVGTFVSVRKRGRGGDGRGTGRGRSREKIEKKRE